jgi:hypothetical protein
MKGVRFGKKGKLSPQFVAPIEIVKGVGKLAYRVALLPDFASMRDVFYFFILRK